jgi:MFS superfamily sulfate permease-like transporter
MLINEPRTKVLEATSGNLLKHDGPAGTVVFLVALPLCLALPWDPERPIFAVIIAGIVAELLSARSPGRR